MIVIADIIGIIVERTCFSRHSNGQIFFWSELTGRGIRKIIEVTFSFGVRDISGCCFFFRIQLRWFSLSYI